MSNVKALYGGPTGLPEPNEDCIAQTRKLLEMAESGEVVGFVAAALYKDSCAGRMMGGFIGGHSLIGALDVARAVVVNMVLDDTQ